VIRGKRGGYIRAERREGNADQAGSTKSQIQRDGGNTDNVKCFSGERIYFVLMILRERRGTSGAGLKKKPPSSITPLKRGWALRVEGSNNLRASPSSEALKMARKQGQLIPGDADHERARSKRPVSSEVKKHSSYYKGGKKGSSEGNVSVLFSIARIC